jgi:hypothetical protein
MPILELQRKGEYWQVFPWFRIPSLKPKDVDANPDESLSASSTIQDP